MGCRTRQVFSWLWLLGATLLMIAFSFGFVSLPTQARIQTQVEAPGQILYQSRQMLTDPSGQNWQAIAFKRVRPDGQDQINLRLVGFPGSFTLDHDRPLVMISALGQTWEAADVTAPIFAEGSLDSPAASYIAQYDLKPIIHQLEPEIPLRLVLPSADGSDLSLRLQPQILQEWQILADRQPE